MRINQSQQWNCTLVRPRFVWPQKSALHTKPAQSYPTALQRIAHRSWSSTKMQQIRDSVAGHRDWGSIVNPPHRILWIWRIHGDPVNQFNRISLGGMDEKWTVASSEFGGRFLTAYCFSMRPQYGNHIKAIPKAQGGLKVGPVLYGVGVGPPLIDCSKADSWSVDQTPAIRSKKLEISDTPMGVLMLKFPYSVPFCHNLEHIFQKHFIWGSELSLCF